jgi:osmotically-inducible protein OsmY
MKTDRQLRDEVVEELDFDPLINSAEIGVEVTDRVVTLSGHPSSYAEKVAAEKAAQRVSGVKAVVVDMRVRLPNDDVHTDDETANAVRSMLHWMVRLGEDAVKVQVENGWVTLSGEVATPRQSYLAERAITQMRSVTGVTNLIEATGPQAGGHVAESIGRALQRHAQRASKHIQIKVRDGTVTLSGKVASYAERSLARGAAWSAPGVHAVIDDLEVE